MLHILLFLLLVLWVSLSDYQASTQIKLIEEPKKEYVVITPEYFQRETPEVVETPKKEIQFTETNPEIQEAVVDNSTRIGDKSVLGASETPLDEGDPLLPTQITRVDPEQKLLNTFNSDFVDASIDLPPAPKTEESQSAETATLQETENIAESEADGQKAEESAPKPISHRKETLAQTDTTVAVPERLVEDKPHKAVEKPETTETLDSHDIGKNETAKGLPNKTERNKKSTAGFQTEQKKTKIIGSLSRDGKSSLDVKKTALGQYYARISKIIELEWQKECLRYRDLIHPGVISMQFSISPSGKVSGLRPYDVVSTSEIQKGFTLQAIRRSKLPNMPKAAIKELDGDNLELIYNFYF